MKLVFAYNAFLNAFLLSRFLQVEGKLLGNLFTKYKNGCDNNEDINVFIGYKHESGRKRLVERISSKVKSRFKFAKALSAVVKSCELHLIENDPDVEYVEVNPKVFMDGEANLYGLNMIKAESPLIPSVDADFPAACGDYDSFTIGIIDSGLAVNHPDIPCSDISNENTNCVGREIGISSTDGPWYDPQIKYHGTHVAGIIGAQIANNFGVRGVASDGRFCFVIARVFGESGQPTEMSSILEAVEWMSLSGVKVINMSLGSPDYSQTASKIMLEARNRGTVLVASAGNSGTTAANYPGSFESVIAVAAVDAKYERAPFSQYNGAVDISAPGVDILSTFPLNSGGTVFLSSSVLSVSGDYLMYSKQGNVNGTVISCPNYGQSKCPGPGKHICLIERGVISFEAKTLNCQAGGGIAAVIFNNEVGKLNAGVSNPTKAKIPAFSITKYDGLALKQQGLNISLSTGTVKGYSYLSGTSMAAPHVSGVIAKIWRICPSCTSDEVIQCVMETAMDLGSRGRDNYYGHGLIQAPEAYTCLVNSKQCC